MLHTQPQIHAILTHTRTQRPLKARLRGFQRWNVKFREEAEIQHVQMVFKWSRVSLIIALNSMKVIQNKVTQEQLQWNFIWLVIIIIIIF